MIGQTVSHYKILEKLGEGGMGIVYKAHDAKLDRTVALKFLPHNLALTETTEARFLQEAKSAAALNHPNICTIYSIEEDDGRQFIVMECIDGETLQSRIRKPGDSGLPLQQVTDWGIQIAEALHEAHSHGIIHRDIKSENIMVNAKNQIKVMDFGLAKLRDSVHLTKTSSTIGTIAYMAPEMIQGGDADARSDIFSFGIVLYEMLAGKMPFRGEHEAAVVYSIVNENPQPLENILPSVPSSFVKIITRALEKDRSKRYQTMGDLLSDLRNAKEPVRYDKVQPVKQQNKATRRLFVPLALAGALAIGVLAYVLLFRHQAESNERIPVAVIDFLNESEEKELNGLSGMLITSLEQSKRLSVLTRSSMFDILKQMGRDSVTRIDERLGREICRRANVRAMVLASIRKFGKNYTIDLKVLDPTSDEYLLTAKEEGAGQESIPSMLDALSERTRIELKEKVAEVKAASQNIATVTTTNLEAYQHYFQGEQQLNHLKLEEAEKEFKQAIALDSTFGLAYYRLAYTIGWNIGTEHVATPYLDKAVHLMDRIPERERYLVRMEQARHKGGFAQALVVAKEMEQRYPNDKEAMFQIGDYSYHSSDLKTAQQYFERVIAMDSTSDRTLFHLADIYEKKGEGQKLLNIALRFVAANPTGASYALLGKAYLGVGQFDAALKNLFTAHEMIPEDFLTATALCQTYLALGKANEAEATFKSLIAKSERGSGTRYGKLADVYRFTGRVKDAMWAINKAIESGFKDKDTSRIAFGYIERAFTMMRFFNDKERGLMEVKNVYRIASGVHNPQVWLNLAVALGFAGHAEMIDKKMLAVPEARNYFLGLDYSLKHECGKAKPLLESVPVQYLPYALSPLAECQLEAGMLDDALSTVTKLRGLMSARGTETYVRNYYLLGRIYEKKNEPKLAIQNFETFLDIWKNADKDVPVYVDAKVRLAKLKEVAEK
ncbi:MAG: protein kinase [Ignavibacteriae bacterium]|nr:protein kinase [Ignavibacteriota bacterium]